ncbi:substrate-binding domain-containing protein [Micromonospora purpureochromogenes]|uniref:substrate-binding domain-containing protein n=1 Tax=Micromonospora purpureochromogenes TaxID=47872 RepID=UPI003F4D4D23
MTGHSAPPATTTATDLHCQAHRCTNDLIALGVLQELTGRGLRVPDDVAIVGYDDIEFAGRRPRNGIPLDQPAPRLQARGGSRSSGPPATAIWRPTQTPSTRYAPAASSSAGRPKRPTCSCASQLAAIGCATCCGWRGR